MFGLCHFLPSFFRWTKNQQILRRFIQLKRIHTSILKRFPQETPICIVNYISIFEILKQILRRFMQSSHLNILKSFQETPNGLNSVSIFEILINVAQIKYVLAQIHATQKNTHFDIFMSQYIHYAPLMMAQKESPRNHPWVIPKKVACLV